MAYAVLLIFLGTLEARSVGVSAVQARYFESWGCLSFGMIPLIGGAGVGALAVLNISASVFRRARFTLRGVGLILTHAFLVNTGRRREWKKKYPPWFFSKAEKI